MNVRGISVEIAIIRVISPMMWRVDDRYLSILFMVVTPP